MRIAVLGPFDIFRGYGSDVPALCMALEDLGHDVVPFPDEIRPGLPRQVTDLLSKQPGGAYDLGIMHVPPFRLRPPAWLRAQTKKVVGWSMWESTVFSIEDWEKVTPLDKNDPDPWSRLDSLLAYDEISAMAFKEFRPQPHIMTLQGGIEVAPWQYVDRDWEGTFRFCMLGELHLRKDPFLAIDAFRELRDDGLLPDAELHLKTSIPGLHPGIADMVPGVHIHHGYWSRDQIVEFYANMHVVLAPSRGEGKNLPAMEIMLTGGTCIATNWGGHTVWMDEEIAYPLDYTLQERSQMSGVEARASKEHLKQLMLHTYTHRDECKRKGWIASERIRRERSWHAVAARALEMVG